MDYAIYKTNDGKNPRVLQRPLLYQNPAVSEKDGFEYDYMTSVNTTEHIHFYISPL